MRPKCSNLQGPWYSINQISITFHQQKYLNMHIERLRNHPNCASSALLTESQPSRRLKCLSPVLHYQVFYFILITKLDPWLWSWLNLIPSTSLFWPLKELLDVQRGSDTVFAKTKKILIFFSEGKNPPPTALRGLHRRFVASFCPIYPHWNFTQVI